MTPLKVLIVAPWGERAGGAEEMLWTILRHLDQTEVEPEVGFLSPGPFVDDVRDLGMRAWSLPETRLRDPIGYARTVRSLTQRIHASRPDVVLAWSAKAHLHLGIAALAARQNTRVVWWQHEIATGHWMERLATLIRADAVGCSSRVGERAQTRLRPRRKTFVVYPGVEVGAMGPPLPREELEIAPEAWVVGIVGRLQPWKGQHKVIRSVAELQEEGIPAVGLIVGGAAFGLSVDYESELRGLARTLGVGDSVRFTGQVADASPYYPMMDVAVNASTDEPFGIVVVEAMAAARPVVAFSGAGPSEVIEDRKNGLLVPDGNLTRALVALYSDPALAASLGVAARDRALAFGAPRAASDFAQALQAVVRDRESEIR